MPDISVWATLISTSGAVVAGVGAVVVTQLTTMRRDTRLAEQQRRDGIVTARREAYTDLVGSAMKLRVQLEVTVRRQWPDMDDKMRAIQEHASQVALHSSRVALLTADQAATAALGLDGEARTLAASVLKGITTNETGGGLFAGRAPDFGAFQVALDALYVAMRPEMALDVPT